MFFVSRVGARHGGQTVLLHSGITRWLNCKCIVMATRPLIPEAVGEVVVEGGHQCVTSKGNTAPGGSFTRANMFSS